MHDRMGVYAFMQRELSVVMMICNNISPECRTMYVKYIRVYIIDAESRSE